MNKLQRELVSKYIGMLSGLKTIGKEIGKDPRTFREELTSLGINIAHPGSVWKKMQNHYAGKFDRPISALLKDIVQGSLLGDGSLRLQSKDLPHAESPSLDEYRELLTQIQVLRKRVIEGHSLRKEDIVLWNEGIELIRNVNTAQFRLHKSIVEIRWVKSIAALFEKEIAIQHTFVKQAYRAQSVKWTCGFDTLSSVQLFDIWKSWYFNNEVVTKKHVPREQLTSLSPDSLLQWYTGDGFYSGTGIGLSTQGFSREDQEHLIVLLQKIGIEATLRRQNKEGEIGIKTDKANRERFFAYLSSATLFDIARSELPQKFDPHFRKDELLHKLRETNPEFFTLDHKPKWEDY